MSIKNRLNSFKHFPRNLQQKFEILAVNSSHIRRVDQGTHVSMRRRDSSRDCTRGCTHVDHYGYVWVVVGFRGELKTHLTRDRGCLQVPTIISNQILINLHSYCEYIVVTLSATCRIHVPCALSPQVITDMNFHLRKPSGDLSSFRVPSNCTLVPCGEVKWISIAPRMVYAISASISTCSMKLRA